MMTISTSTPRLSEAARHCIIPEGIVTSDFPKLNRVAKRLGFTFDLWQQGLGTVLLGKRENGLYACGVGGAVVSIPRQVGKTFTIGLIVLLMCVTSKRPLLVFWTAHHTRTSAETFKDLTAICDRQALRGYVKHIRRANGQEAIEFINGSRILFGARERGFGRGLHTVDVEVFDEAQILSESALENMVPSMNASPNALAIYMGTPPRPNDPGEVFIGKRQGAIKGVDADTFYVEFSADKDCNLDDRSQWEKANPSYPHRTSESAILRMRRQLSDDSFRREALGVWDEHISMHAINTALWEQAAVSERPNNDGLVGFALDMSPDRTAFSIGACMKYKDGTAHIELAEYRDPSRDGTQWAVDWIASRWSKTAVVVIDYQSPATVLVPELTEAHVKVTQTSLRDIGRAVERFQNMLVERKLTHLRDQQPLDIAVGGAILRNVGQNGMQAWNKSGSDIDISPLVAVTLALEGTFITKRRPGRKQRIN
ncbi:phage terminase large subunit [Alloscardovia omnicolens]|uniref:phage terminase large subunit n=1 Tax=Alloscardovia omnicolens TaxID=419015 RepID=UPI0037579544